MTETYESIQIPQTMGEVYRELKISPQSLLQQYITSAVYGKINKYEAETLFFEKKYSSTYEAFSKKVNSMINQENYEWDDDLMDWEYAQEALLRWKQKLNAVKQ